MKKNQEKDFAIEDKVHVKHAFCKSNFPECLVKERLDMSLDSDLTSDIAPTLIYHSLKVI
jgi:hypothetical protein